MTVTFWGFLHSFFTNSKLLTSLEERINFAFCRLNSIESALPIPEEAPVIQTVLFEKSMGIILTLQDTNFHLEIVLLI